jgi:hypothetical protein
VFIDFSPGAPQSIVRDGIPVGGGAVVRLVLITVIALVIARWRLSRLRLTGAAD